MLDVDKLILDGSQWDSDTKHWLQTQYTTRCFTNLGLSAIIRIRYIRKPLEKIEGSNFYKDEEVMSPFSDVELCTLQFIAIKNGYIIDIIKKNNKNKL